MCKEAAHESNFRGQNVTLLVILLRVPSRHQASELELVVAAVFRKIIVQICCEGSSKKVKACQESLTYPVVGYNIVLIVSRGNFSDTPNSNFVYAHYLTHWRQALAPYFLS